MLTWPEKIKFALGLLPAIIVSYPICLLSLIFQPACLWLVLVLLNFPYMDVS